MWRSNSVSCGIARTPSRRTKRLILSGVAVLGTLGGLSAATAPAYAGTPPASFVREWAAGQQGPGQYADPTAVAADGAGHIWVADQENSRVQEFAYNNVGSPLHTLGGDVPGYFAYPTGVAVDSAGNVFVSQDGTFSIDVFNSNGTYQRAFGSRGSAPGQFDFPGNIAVDGAGDVYVADTGNNRIEKFNSGGTILQTWGGLGAGNMLGQFNKPAAVALDGSGNLYVADTGNNRVEKLTTSGNWVAWGTLGSLAGPYFNQPEGIAVDRFGNVFVADTRNNRVEQFDSKGIPLQSWGTYGTGTGQMDLPVGLAAVSTSPWAIGPRGTTIYVTQAGSNRVQQFWEQQSGGIIPCAVCVTVPNLYGTFERTASSELASLGLNVSEYVSVNTQVGCNDVFSQSPAAGASVFPGSTVTLGLADNPNDPGGCR